MLRLHFNKVALPSRAALKRTASNGKARKRAFTVAEALEPSTVVMRKCFTCETKLRCDQKPVAIASYLGRPVIPKFNAPLICTECRKDKQKFALAHRAMLEFFEGEAVVVVAKKRVKGEK
jgi:hypothetical protein